MLEEREPEKPFVVGEFGFQDERSTHLLNPIMAEYRYAIWTVDFVAQALNRGAAGMSIWTMHEVYYPGNGFMEYGLWEWANEDWRVRPVYHAFGMFPRLTERGDASYVCESSHPQSFRAARVEDTVFWVNSNDEPLEVEFRGVEAAEARVMTQDNIEGDRETGELVPLEANTLLAPARSFGYIRLAP
jgi:hypothetical protein